MTTKILFSNPPTGVLPPWEGVHNTNPRWMDIALMKEKTIEINRLKYFLDRNSFRVKEILMLWGFKPEKNVLAVSKYDKTNMFLVTKNYYGYVVGYQKQESVFGKAAQDELKAVYDTVLVEIPEEVQMMQLNDIRLVKNTVVKMPDRHFLLAKDVDLYCSEEIENFSTIEMINFIGTKIDMLSPERTECASDNSADY